MGVVPDNSNVDRRSAPRRQPAVGTVFRVDDSTADRAFGLVWNISTSGVSMLTAENTGCGTILRGHIVSNDGRHRLPIVLHIVHIRRLENGDHFLGAQFDSPLTSAQIQPFLFE